MLWRTNDNESLDLDSMILTTRFLVEIKSSRRNIDDHRNLPPRDKPDLSE